MSVDAYYFSERYHIINIYRRYNIITEREKAELGINKKGAKNETV